MKLRAVGKSQRAEHPCARRVPARVIERAYFILLITTPFRCSKLDLQELLLLAFDGRYAFIQIFYAFQSIPACASNFLMHANAHRHIHTY